MIRESFQVGVVTLEEEKGEQPDRRGLALIIVQPNFSPFQPFLS